MQTQAGPRRAGAALMELIVTIVVVGVFAAAAVLGIGETLRSLQQQRVMRSATILADDLMREIRSKAFADPDTPGTFGPEESPPRRNFDDVDDYDGLSNSPPQTLEGAPIAGYDDFSQCATVVNVRPDALNAQTPEPDGSTDFKRVTVVIQKGYLVKRALKKGEDIVSAPDIVLTNVSAVSRHD